jgi:hypothetical protein
MDKDYRSQNVLNIKEVIHYLKFMIRDNI